MKPREIMRFSGMHVSLMVSMTTMTNSLSANKKDDHRDDGFYPLLKVNTGFFICRLSLVSKLFYVFLVIFAYSKSFL